MKQGSRASSGGPDRLSDYVAISWPCKVTRPKSHAIFVKALRNNFQEKTMTQIEQFGTYTATVRFRRDAIPVRPEAEPLDGNRLTVQALWVIEEGPFEGDFAMSIDQSARDQFGVRSVAWIASSSLTDIEPAHRSR